MRRDDSEKDSGWMSLTGMVVCSGVFDILVAIGGQEPKNVSVSVE